LAVPNAAVVRPKVQRPSVATSWAAPPSAVTWAALSAPAKAIVAAPAAMNASPIPVERSEVEVIDPDPSVGSANT